MFLRKKQKPWVRFVNLIPGVEKVHPIVMAQETKMDWLKAAAHDYKEERKARADDPLARFSSVSRCPGIASLFRHAYVVPSPVDFVITTYNDPEGRFMAESSANYANLDNHAFIGQHTAEQLSKYIPFRDDTIHSVVKVQTKWRVTMSPETVLLQIPVPYPDHNIFTAVHGILDGSYEQAVTVQLFWHKKNQRTLIKAGTPLCYYIPIQRDWIPELKVERCTADDEYLDQAMHYLHDKQFNKENRVSWYRQARALITDRLSRL